MKPELLIVYITAPVDEAESIANRLVETHLVACVNIVYEVKSIYRWKGKICNDRESLLIAKTTDANLDGIKSLIKDIHSYEVPEVIAVKIEDGSSNYLKWIIEEASRKEE